MKTIIIIILSGLIQLSFGQNKQQHDTLTATEAASHIGEYVIVKAKVVTTFFDDDNKIQLTYLNLDQKFPDNPMTVIIYKEQADKLGINASDYKGKTIIVKGKMELIPYESNQKKPCIKIYKKEQLQIVE